MKREQSIIICIADDSGGKQEVVKCRYRYLPARLLKLLFGELCEVLILTPGKSVRGVLVQEEDKDKKRDEGD